MTVALCAAALGIGIVTAASGQLTYKLWATRGSWLLLAGALAQFVVAQVAFFCALFELEIGIVYMSTALSQVLVLVLAREVVGEPLSRDHGIAVGLIVLGIVLYAS